MEEIPPDVSVLIVNFNGRKFLEQCLSSLFEIDYSFFEVVLVDNASTDDSLDILKAFPKVILVRSDKNLGFAGGNNLGLPNCRGKYVLLLNSDTEVTKSFLSPLVKYLDQKPKVGIVQSKMFLPRFGGTLDVCGSFLTRFGFLYHYGYYKQDSAKYAKSYPVFTAKGACMMFRRELIESIGGYLFNEDYFCYYEETDFCHRAWIAGFETHFVHESKVEHFQGGTSESAFGSDYPTRQFLKNQTYSLLCNLSLGSLVRIFPFYLAIFSAGALASLICCRLALFRSYYEAACFSINNLDKIKKQRSLVKKFRRIEDRDIFRKSMKNPRLSYFSKTFSGKLRSYQDVPV